MKKSTGPVLRRLRSWKPNFKFKELYGFFLKSVHYRLFILRSTHCFSSSAKIWRLIVCWIVQLFTGKSLSEALIFASINPQYDNRLFIELPWKLHVLPMFCTCSFHGNSMNNLLSYCGLVDARISAFEKDLPVQKLSFKAIS